MNYLVTGGSRGIGANVVREAARLGHDVAFTYVAREDDALAVAQAVTDDYPERTVRAYQLDVRRSADVERVVEQIQDEFETIEVLVNNAGITRDNLVVSMSDDEWADVIATNLTGPFQMCRAVLPLFIAERFGRIINVSSLVCTGGSGQANYAASKAGLNGLTQSIAKEYGRRGVTANTVVPGFFETDMTREGMPDSIREFWRTYCPTPKGRTGELEELSAVIHFLASKEAAYVNGQSLRVTGGLDWGP